MQHHQKPPPAYGTAISQIRSQNNQNKHQVTGSSAAHQQHQTLQAHIALQQQQVQNLHQQQNLHHNVRIHIPPPPPPIPTPVKLSYSSKNQELPAQHHAATVRHNHQQLHQPHQNKTVLSQQQHQQSQQQQQNNNENIQNSKNHIINSNDILNKSTKSVSSTSAGAGTSSSTVNNASALSHPHVSISPSTASASMAAVAASTLGRHTNSPFAALLAAAAGAPSPSSSSSVLRYAESPVAHYLERENGDFIVQETPKHIVECVETDNGEFSVIERIYQSPPSVLHIHDDDDDDDDNGRDQMESSVDNESTDMKCKKQEVSQDSDNEKSKQNTGEHHNKIKNSSNSSCKKSNHSDPHQSGANEIVDFVSISSDSGDEEEFISQDRKDHSTTESNAKIQPSTTPSSTSQSTLSLLSSSSCSVATASGSDDQPTPSLSNSIPSNSLHSPSTVNTAQTQQNSTASSSNGTTVRKKSSKNTITVLSDVQLNLNEYLDLVGNIIASSKVAAQRKTLASIAPMPLVKIEKEEPIDEYITTYPSTTNTNFEIVPPPLKANKHETEETTDNHSSSSSYIETNNHNIGLINEIKQDEKDEKKPQVLENITGNETALSSFANSNAPTSSTTINSSHVTSVIRMASTSQHQAQHQQHTQQLQSLENNKNSNEAEDLSQPQSKVQPMTNVKSMSQPSLVRKGPKKLVIKPKSSKTEVLPRENKPHQNVNDNDQQLPTTSARAKQESMKHISDDAVVQVKNEPIASIAYENQQQSHQPFQTTAGFSILEQHLNSKEPILDFKEEKPCLTEASVPATTIIKEMKVENNVNDDARVLYDFANSKKSQNESPSVFPSSMSVFSNIQTSTENANANANSVQQRSKLINQEMDNSASSSTYSSQSAMDVTIPSEGQNESTTTTTNTSTANGQSHQQTHQIFTDFPFSYLYNNIPGTNEQVDVKNLQQFTTFYQNGSHGNNNSGSNINNNNNNNNGSALLLEDSSSTKHYNEYEQQHHLNHNHQPSTSHQPWFNNTNYAASEHNVASVSTNHSTANINSLSVDGSAALDNTEVGKYLDLDACKREQNIDMTVGERLTVPPPPPPSSSTSCSFNGATDNSMAGICSTGATLNIRTDEKMPAKGEISEQESNCDIDNSWSQPVNNYICLPIKSITLTYTYLSFRCMVIYQRDFLKQHFLVFSPKTMDGIMMNTLPYTI